MRRAPTLLVALCAAVVELIVLAAAGNQWVFDHLIKHASTNELARDRALKATLTAFPWRFTPEHDQRMLWLGELVAVVGLIIAVFLLVFVFVAPMRAPRSFGAVFLGTWGIVVTLTQIAAIGATMIAYSDISQDTDGLGRWWYAAFTGPSAGTVLFGIASGLLVAIVAGILAVTTSRRIEEVEEPGMLAPGDEAPAWSAALGSTQAMGGMGEPPPGWPRRESEPPPWPQPWAQPQREPEEERRNDWSSVTESTGVTQALPPEPEPAEPTTDVTRPRQSPSELPGRPPGSTARLPLPEDDRPRGMGR